ncbi:hypothetical protein P3T36_007410 [Kitasatospora sp. MAP12-15]|nr:hypothetical protein [Kitasatospora sp. MAP12-44]
MPYDWQRRPAPLRAAAVDRTDQAPPSTWALRVARS